ncbi:MAG: translation elongation factor Ts [Spirochaetae bacterium HGW-Spirochaetae-9]|nr:MAG: translation elongation factor Ts [Spirochaetae bacterium HGW-Spirochaetae-9]
MVVSIENLKALRESTGAGMMDCKKALLEAKGDQDAAKALIAEWGLAVAVKRADRETHEGRVAIALRLGGGIAGLAALACETDFVSSNELYKKAVQSIAAEVLTRRLSAPNAAVEAIVADMSLRMKEHIVLKGIGCVEADADEYLDTYLHGDGSIGVALTIKADRPSCFQSAEVRALLHDLCLQIAARNPGFVKREDVPPVLIEEKLKEFRDDIDADPKFSDKSEALKTNVIAGRLRKFLATNCLLEQAFIKDESMSVEAYLAAIRKAAGADLEIAGFLRLGVR